MHQTVVPSSSLLLSQRAIPGNPSSVQDSRFTTRYALYQRVGSQGEHVPYDALYDFGRWKWFIANRVDETRSGQTDRLEHFALKVLHCVNRTSSGGVAYEVLDAIFALTRSRFSNEPRLNHLRIELDVGAFWCTRASGDLAFGSSVKAIRCTLWRFWSYLGLPGVECEIIKITWGFNRFKRRNDNENVQTVDDKGCVGGRVRFMEDREGTTSLL
jgi:hypothetical protein